MRLNGSRVSRLVGVSAQACLWAMPVNLSGQDRGFARGGGGTSMSRVASPAVVASWMSYENYVGGKATTLLRCDLSLSDPVMKMMMPIICGQMRP
jgi:hypothetical protein